MRRIPVDQYFKEDHFEDCRVPQDVCVVDYNQQYEGVESKSVSDNDK